MNENPIISVIVTAYNVEKYLRKCLDSLLAQTFSSIEFIVVDDGSTDESGRICDEYEAKDERIRVIHRVNGGPSAARNDGIELARGEYIGYVDGDDWVEPEMYEQMYDACRESGAQIAICSYRHHGEYAEEMHPTGNRIELSREEAMELYIMGDPQYHIYHAVWSKLFERNIIQNLRFQEGHQSEDIMYTTCALGKAEKCIFLDTLYYNYRTDRSGSIMNTHLEERRFRDEIPFTREQIAYLRGLGMEELSDKASYQFYRRLLFYFIDFRERKMKAAGKRVIQFLRSEKAKIRMIYQKDYVAGGDKVRMKVALAMPGLYYVLVKCYDRYVIPLRQKRE